MTFFKRLAILPALWAGFLVMAGAAMAQNGPKAGAIGLQPPVTETAQMIVDFHDLLLWIITIITIFVMVLMGYVIWRFREKANPVPSRTTHNTPIEIAWTIVPVFILLAVAFPSLKLLYFADRAAPEDVEMTIKVIGKQWYWSFEYPDHGNFTFDATLLPEADAKAADLPWLLATDETLVLPVETTIRVLITADDVLHNFALPSFGIKLDAVPGRINETWTRVPAKHEGEVHYGQCSELCGAGHSYMPIMVKMVSKADFAKWVEEAKENYAQVDSPANRVSVAEAAASAAE